MDNPRGPLLKLQDVPQINLQPGQKSHTRTPSRSPTRSPTRRSIIDDILTDLSPASTLEAFTSANPSGKLRASVEAATPSERAFGIRATLACKKIQEWVDELSSWPWPQSAGSTGFEIPAAKRRKVDTDTRSRRYMDTSMEDGEILEEPYMGSLPSSDVLEYERRIDEITDDMEDLDVEGIKSTVLNTHFSPRSRPSSSSSNVAPIPTPILNYTRMDDFTAIVTATVLQALPNLGRLMRLMDVWSIRLTVLRKTPPLLEMLNDAEAALKSGWQAVRIPNQSDSDEGALERKSFETMRDVLQGKVTRLGQELDYMLDTLEGREDTLPEHWLDRMEGIETDYGEWVVSGDRKVREGEWSRMAKMRREMEEMRRAEEAARLEEERQRRAEETRLRLEEVERETARLQMERLRKEEEDRMRAEAEAREAARLELERLGKEEEARLRAAEEAAMEATCLAKLRKQEEDRLRSENEARDAANLEAARLQKEQNEVLLAHKAAEAAAFEAARLQRETIDNLEAKELAARLEAQRVEEEERLRLAAESSRLEAERARKQEEGERLRLAAEFVRLRAEQARKEKEEALRLEQVRLAEAKRHQESARSLDEIRLAEENARTAETARQQTLWNLMTAEECPHDDLCRDSDHDAPSSARSISPIPGLLQGAAAGLAAVVGMKPSPHTNHLLDQATAASSPISSPSTFDGSSDFKLAASDPLPVMEQRRMMENNLVLNTENGYPRDQNVPQTLTNLTLPQADQIPSWRTLSEPNETAQMSSHIIEATLFDEISVSNPWGQRPASESLPVPSLSELEKRAPNLSQVEISAMSPPTQAPSELEPTVVQPVDVNDWVPPPRNVRRLSTRYAPELDDIEASVARSSIAQVEDEWSPPPRDARRLSAQYVGAPDQFQLNTQPSTNDVLIPPPRDARRISIPHVQEPFHIESQSLPHSRSVPSTNRHSRNLSIISGYSTSDPSPEIHHAEPAEYFRPMLSAIKSFRSQEESDLVTPVELLPPQLPVSLDPSKSPNSLALEHSPSSPEPEKKSPIISPDTSSLSSDGTHESKIEKIQEFELDILPPTLARQTSITPASSPVKGVESSPLNSSESSRLTASTKNIGDATYSPVIPSSPVLNTEFEPFADVDSPSAGRAGLRIQSHDYSPPDSPPPVPAISKRRSHLVSPNLIPSSPIETPITPISDEAPVFPSLDITPVFSSPKKPSSDDQLQAQISTLLESIPAHIRLSSEPDNDAGVIGNTPYTSQSQTLRPKKTRRSLTPYLRSSSAMSSRAPTPSFTLAPAYSKSTPRPRHQNGNPEIKLYHLSRSTGEAPIKLFVRLVGENGERVMVRVGGGWADLGEYLREYASHHGRRVISGSTASDKVEIQDLPSRTVSSSSTATIRNSTGNGNGRSSPITSRPSSVLERERPMSSLYIRKSRHSIGERSESSTSTFSFSPQTPTPVSPPRSAKFQHSTSGSFETPPSSGAIGTSGGERMRSVSRLSYTDEDSNLGLAGPKGRSKIISERDQEWVESMKEKVRLASAEKEREKSRVGRDGNGRKSFGELEKVGGTKRLFRKG